MSRRSTRIIALAAAGLALTGVADSASAAKPKHPGTPHVVRHPTPPTTSTRIIGWQTGTGKTSDSMCQAYANMMQDELDQVVDADPRDNATIGKHDAAFDRIESAALGKGCAFAY